MRAAPDSLQWALSGLNFFWSLLTLLTGVAVFRIAGTSWQAQPGSRSLLAALGVYWLVHSLYLLARPFPLPRALEWLGLAFLAFAGLQAVLYGIGALASRRPNRDGAIGVRA